MNNGAARDVQSAGTICVTTYDEPVIRSLDVSCAEVLRAFPVESDVDLVAVV